MIFNATIQGNEEESISCRIFSSARGMWWDGTTWSSNENSADTIDLSFAGSSRFFGQVYYPDEKDIIIEYVDHGGIVIGEDRVEEEPKMDLPDEYKNILLETRDETRLARKLQSNKAVISEDGSSVTIFDDDNITVLYSFNISQDQRVRIPI